MGCGGLSTQGLSTFGDAIALIVAVVARPATFGMVTELVTGESVGGTGDDGTVLKAGVVESNGDGGGAEDADGFGDE